jgi:hypothetical protein
MGDKSREDARSFARPAQAGIESVSQRKAFEDAIVSEQKRVSVDPRLPLRDKPFAFHYSAHFLERGADPSFREPNLPQALHVAELLATVFEEQDCPRKGKTTLKQAGFVNYV